MMNQHITGIIEFEGHRGGALRPLSLEIDRNPSDPRIPPHFIAPYKLREACLVECGTKRGDRGRIDIAEIRSINGMKPEEWKRVEDFARRTAIDPNEQITLAGASNDISMRVVDLLCPVGKGQRALIVSPPKAGKTMLMQQFAHAISTNHPEINLIVLLVDERPEEVTDMSRTIRGEVFASSNDSDRDSHVRLAKLVLEYAKRKAETGRDVVLLLDSLTRMGRAFNAAQRSSGRTMSGGVDIRALEIPKRIFGSARALEGGGSLTIIATALVETNSRMDELIFQEFKGTGNMELVLSRDLANERIFPAINIQESGTRREELLFAHDTGRYQMLRRALNRMKPKEAMLAMLQMLGRYPTNGKLLDQVSKELRREPVH
ncbi:MAG: transcription termination factor Rho [Ignavibacteriae bacterium]|nr:transcription termination factor Rho [Ignavibacteria bacterium]MBI3365400.1 transcription termination factor Rho [Ignavibacteriota bacterium]